MAAYLNQNYYGNESYGVAAAARGYFGVDARGPDPRRRPRSSPRSPSRPRPTTSSRNAVEECVDPAADPETCEETQLVVPDDAPIVQRRNYVLSQMQATGGTPLTGDELSADDFAAAKDEPVVLAPQRLQAVARPTVRVAGPRGAHGAAVRRGGRDVPAARARRPRRSRPRSTCDIQGIAEKWVKAATIVPHAKNPRRRPARSGSATRTGCATCAARRCATAR